MYCAHCSNSIPDDSTFCIQCGRQLQTRSPVAAAATNQTSRASRTSEEESGRRRLIVCIILSLVAIAVFHNLAGLLAIAVIVLFFYFKQIPLAATYKLGAMGVLIAATIAAQFLYLRGQPTVNPVDQAQPATVARQHAPSAVPPSVPPPRFRLFKSKTQEQTIYVVPVSTTDEQLRSLLWLFRQKVRAGAFKEIGITQPTAKQSGEYGYNSGMLVVYRGQKCANEGYVGLAQAEKGNLGPCGYGEHDDAYYQWGIQGDPNKDEAGLKGKNGDMVVVFDFKDNWHSPTKQ